MSASMVGAIWRRSDSPWGVAGLAAVAYGLFVLARLASFGGDPSVFVVAGDRLTDRAVAGFHLRVLRDSYGFDGQFFYRLAIDPLTRERVAYGVTLDTPAYRQQRILFPLIVWAVSAGRPERVPSALLLVNWVAVILIGWWAGRLAQTAQRHAAVGVVVALYPGYLYTLSRDLSEIVALGGVVAALTLLRLRRPAIAALALTLALLARETTLLVAVGVACAAVVARGGPRAHTHVPLWVGGVPIVVWFAWQVALFTRWGVFPCLAASNNLDWPLVALGPLVSEWVAAGQPYGLLRLRLLAYVVAMALAAAVSVRSSHAPLHEKISLALYGGLLVAVGHDVWEEDWGFMRAAAELCVLSGVVLLGAPQRWLARCAAVATVIVWHAVAVSLVTRL